MLLLCVVHADLEDGRPLVAQQGDGAAGGVQLVDAAAPVLIPEQEVLVVAQAKGMVELLAFVHSLVGLRRKKGVNWGSGALTHHPAHTLNVVLLLLLF